MSEDRPHTPPDPERPRSDLEDGVENLSRAMGGLMSRLLGEKVTGVPLDRSKPTLSAEADEVLDELGSKAGRWLRAAGEGLRQHPTEPAAALEQMMERRHDEVETDEGVAPLTVGLKSLASGLYRSAEGVLDIVAPRRKDGSGGEEPEGLASDDDTEASEE